MAEIFLLTLRQLTGKWRLIIMTVLAALPVIITVIVMNDSEAPPVGVFEQIVLSGMLAGSIAPLVVLAIAAAAFGNELEDRTLANLTLSPVPRWKIALPKLLATIAIAAPFIAVSALVTSHIAFMGEWKPVLAVTGAAIACVAMYASLFVWMGLIGTQAIGIGLLYVVLWEGLLTRYVSGVRLLSIRHYSTSLMHTLDEARFATAPNLGTGGAIALATLVIVGFLLLTVRQLRRMDVP